MRPVITFYPAHRKGGGGGGAFMRQQKRAVIAHDKNQAIFSIRERAWKCQNVLRECRQHGNFLNFYHLCFTKYLPSRYRKIYQRKI